VADPIKLFGGGGHGVSQKNCDFFYWTTSNLINNMAILITSFFVWGPGPTNWDFCMAKSNQLSVWGQGPSPLPPVFATALKERNT